MVEHASCGRLVMTLKAVPITLSQANSFILEHHRHHGTLRFHKFSVGVENGGKLVGVCIVNRPVNPRMDNGITLEVARLCTDGTNNACSLLLSRAAQAAKASRLSLHPDVHACPARPSSQAESPSGRPAGFSRMRPAAAHGTLPGASVRIAIRPAKNSAGCGCSTRRTSAARLSIIRQFPAPASRVLLNPLSGTVAGRA